MAPDSFGRQLRRLRKAAGLTQQELADRAHLARRSINDLEYDRRGKPHEATVDALCDALDLSEEQRSSLQVLLVSDQVAQHVLWREDLFLPSNELIGREADLAALRALAQPEEAYNQPLDGTDSVVPTRLITLIGPAGVGKTHLALQLAADLAAHYRDGVYRVDLAGLPSHQDLSRAIARAIGVPALSGLDLLDALCGAIGSRQILIVLDGCEDLLDPVAEVATALLRRCPSLRFVIPCRVPLDAYGEYIWRVEPFDPALPTTLSALHRHPAVHLMATRAAAFDAPFPVTRDSQGLLEALCRRSGGVPLALGLLAGPLLARRSTQPDVRMALPQGDESLVELIAWAYRQLATDSRRMLCHLAILAASWPREAVGFVAPMSANGWQPDPLLPLLWAGMIQAEGQDPALRYRLHPAIQAYALGELRAAGEEALARSSHLAWCINLAREWAQPYGGARRHSERSGAIDYADHDFTHALLWAHDHDRERGRQLARFLRLALRDRHGEETSWARFLKHLE